MSDRDPRPPPATCDRVKATIQQSADCSNLRQFADQHPHEFNNLLAHAAICNDCSQAVKAAFPSGFSTSEDLKGIDERLTTASEELGRV